MPTLPCPHGYPPLARCAVCDAPEPALSDLSVQLLRILGQLRIEATGRDRADAAVPYLNVAATLLDCTLDNLGEAEAADDERRTATRPREPDGHLGAEDCGVCDALGEARP